jgi:hypothetical protein
VTEGVLQTLEDERDATLYYLLARHPGRALVSQHKPHKDVLLCAGLYGQGRVCAEVWLQTLEDERDATLYYLLARHPGRALVSLLEVSLIG